MSNAATARKSLSAWLLVPVALGAGALLLYSSGGDSPTDLASGAGKACQRFMADILREPESVRWESISPWIIEPGSTTYVVRMTYRARNGFGGMTRETRDCRVRFDGPAGWFFIGLE